MFVSSLGAAGTAVGAAAAGGGGDFFFLDSPPPPPEPPPVVEDGDADDDGTAEGVAVVVPLVLFAEGAFFLAVAIVDIVSGTGLAG